MSSNAENIWRDIILLAGELDAVDLGLGMADFEPPSIITDALKEMANNPSSPMIHQYCERFGHRRLLKILARIFSPLLVNEIDPLINILITVGAHHGIHCAFTTLLQPNDEIIVFEPYYVNYNGIFEDSKVKVVTLTLFMNPSSNSGHFTFDKQELKSKFNSKTKLFFLNNPNNPTGKVFTRDELDFIADLCNKHDVIVISDEVYFSMVHPPNKFISFASLPGMWDRTITIGSAGKCFSITGWKLGWCIGPEHFIKTMEVQISRMSFSTCTPLQEALAIALEKEFECRDVEKKYLNNSSQMIMEKFGRVSKILPSVGLIPIIPEGGYYMLVDISKVQDFRYDEKDKQSKDVQFAIWILKNYRICCTPLSLFLTEENKKLGENYIRLCCFKSEATLSKTEKLFEAWKSNSNTNSIFSNNY